MDYHDRYFMSSTMPTLHSSQTSQKVLVAMFLALVFLSTFHQIRDPDTFYHLKAGQFMWDVKQVPHTDIFSFTAHGAPWITHEWLAQIFFYLIYNATGPWGLLTLVSLLAVLSYAVVIKLALDKGANPYIAILVAFLIGYGTFGFWIPRPQSIALLLLTILLFCLEKYRDGRKHSYLFIIPLVLWLWANVHASVILGVVIVLFYVLALEVQRRFPSFFGATTLQRKEIFGLFWSLLGSFVLTLLNPNFYSIYLYGFAVREVAIALNIVEYLPFYRASLTGTTLSFVSEFILFGIFFLWYLGIRKESRDAVALGLFAGISIMPFIGGRYIAYWPFAVIIFGSIGISKAFQGTIDRLPRWLFVTFIVICGTLFLFKDILLFPREAVSDITLPVGSAAFLRDNGIANPLFNTYNDGGYLLWALSPVQRVFIDGRSEVYVGQPLRDYLTIVNVAPGWRSLIDGKYGINAAILPYWSQSIATDMSGLFKAFRQDGFILVYWDDHAIVMLRDVLANKALIRQYGTSHVDPFVAPEVVTNSISETSAELKTLAARFPNAIAVQDYAQRFAASHP